MAKVANIMYIEPAY